jgi:hypothetical protein
MKYITPRPFADPAVAARKLLEIANATEAVENGRHASGVQRRAELCHLAGLAVEA